MACHFYQYQFRELRPSRAILGIWKTKCIPKIKFFAWLLLNDRLNARNILRRRKKVSDEGYNCVMCHNSEEETAAISSSTALQLPADGLLWELFGRKI
jgi:hypothetical protein